MYVCTYRKVKVVVVGINYKLVVALPLSYYKCSVV